MGATAGAYSSALTWETERREPTADMTAVFVQTRESTVVDVVGEHIHQTSILLETTEATSNSGKQTGGNFVGEVKDRSSIHRPDNTIEHTLVSCCCCAEKNKRAVRPDNTVEHAIVSLCCGGSEKPSRVRRP